MSTSRIPLNQVFRSDPRNSAEGPALKRSNTVSSITPPDISLGVGANTSRRRSQSIQNPPQSQQSQAQPPAPPQSQPQPRSPIQNRNSELLARFRNRTAIMATPGGRGTRTPQMLEYERQAEERAREQEAMQEERDRMNSLENDMQQELDRIAQEEYEMKQYYEAEQLRHAEEMRLHQEEVRRHQERARAHERRVMDHEASSEAFAKVIAMPAKPGRERQVSFLAPATRGAGRGGQGGGGANGQ